MFGEEILYLCLHSRATVVTWASLSVRHPSARCMDPGQILWEATYNPYLQTNFQIFTILCSFSLNIEPHGSENVKTLLLPSLVFDRFQQNFMINMSVMGDICYGITFFFDELSKIFKFKEI